MRSVKRMGGEFPFAKSLMIMLALAAFGFAQPSAYADVELYVALKRQGYVQIDANSDPRLDQPGYSFFAMVQGSAEREVVGGSVTPPGMDAVDLASSDGVEWDYFLAFSTLGELNAQFPDGAYSFSIETGSSGVLSASLDLAENYPSPTRVSNFVEAQTVDPDSDFAIAWTAFENPGPDDFIQVEVMDFADETVYKTEELSVGAWATSHVIPESVLEPGLGYTVEISFFHVSDQDGVGYALCVTSTAFSLHTTGEPVLSGELEFNFTHDEGVLEGDPPAAVAGSMAWPPGTAYFLRAYIVDDDPADSALFTGPAGSGLDDTLSVHSWYWDGGKYYTAPDVATGPGAYPPDGQYVVGYKSEELVFDVAPDAENRQVVPIPAITVGEDGRVERIDWEYRKIDGSLASDTSFIDEVHLRLERHNDHPPLYERSVSGGSTHHIIDRPVFWSDVRRTVLDFDDDKDSQFRSGFRRLGVFDHQYEFKHDDGGFCEPENGVAQARLSFPPKTSYSVRFTSWNTDVPESVVFASLGLDPPGLHMFCHAWRWEDEGVYFSFSSSGASPPDDPDGGLYHVIYKGEELTFDREDPRSETRRVIPFPSVSLGDGGTVLRIDWHYRDIWGNTVAAPDFIREIRIRFMYQDMVVWRDLYEAYYLPGDSLSHVLQDSISWDEVTDVVFEWRDDLNNIYTSGFKTPYRPDPPAGLPNLAGWDGASSNQPQWRFQIAEPYCSWGDPIHIKFAVINENAAPSGPFAIRLYLSPDNVIDETDYPLGTIPVENGIEGYDTFGLSDFSYVVALPPANPVGEADDYFIGMVVDADSEVEESDEGDNANLGEGRDMDSLMVWERVPSMTVSLSDPSPEDELLDFGEVEDSSIGFLMGMESIRMINNGASPVVVRQDGILLADGTRFHILFILSSLQNYIFPDQGPATIAPNGEEMWWVFLGFDPEPPGEATDRLCVEIDDAENTVVSVDLAATGVAVPDIQTDDGDEPSNDNSTDFGKVAADGPGDRVSTRSIRIENKGAEVMHIDTDGVFLETSEDFQILSVTSDVQGEIDLGAGPGTVAPSNSETWTVQVAFDPSNAGVFSDALMIHSDAPDREWARLALNGIGVSAHDLAVADSDSPADDRMVDFGVVHADGPGKNFSLASVVLANAGQAPLQVLENGIFIDPPSASDFSVEAVESSLQGPVDLSAGPKELAGSSSERWIVSLKFDPVLAGTASATLKILSDDPDEPAVDIDLAGEAITAPDMVATVPGNASDDLSIPFGAQLNDGAGGAMSLSTVLIENRGAQALAIFQNGIGLNAPGPFSIEEIESSLTGPVDLTSGPVNIAPGREETWTVSILFDPDANGEFQNSLEIASDDPDTPLATVDLAGQGVQPLIEPETPSAPVGVPALMPFAISWRDEYAAGDASIDLFLDTDLDPSGGLVAVASDISEDSVADSFFFRPSENLAGETFYVYARIRAGAVSNGEYAPGPIFVEPAGTLAFLSPSVTTSPDYFYEYEYNGITYSGQVQLEPGKNTVVATAPDGQGGEIDHAFEVFRTDGLLDGVAYTHDIADRVVSSTDSRGVATTAEYDAMGRVAKIAASDGGFARFAYNPSGFPVSMQDNHGWTFYGYDDLYRAVSVIRSANETTGDPDDIAVGYEYNLAGQRTAVVYPGGERIEYGYDSAGRLSSVSDPDSGNIAEYEYDHATGLLSRMNRANGVSTVYGYDGAARLVEIVHEKADDGALIARFHYELDEGGRRTQLHLTVPDESTPDPDDTATRKEKYSYDAFGQVVEVVYSDDEVFDADDRAVSYSYDLDGNRVSMTVREEGGVSERRYDYTYGNDNRLLRIEDQSGEIVATFGYDAAGNRISKAGPDGAVFYTYDYRNLLVQVETETSLIQYAYDGAGRRLSKTVDGVETRFVVDAAMFPDQVLEERDEAGLATARYANGGQRISARFPGAASAEYYLADGIGSTRFLADAAGTPGELFSYDIFGAPRFDPSGPNRFAFAGERVEPETGLIYLRSRYYDPETGTFTGKDPLGIVSGANGYAYVQNGPLDFTDPDGELPVYGVALLAGAGAGMVGQVIEDVINWKPSPFRKYFASAVGGSAGGMVALHTFWNPYLAAAATGSTSSFTKTTVDQAWQIVEHRIRTGEWKEYKYGEIAGETVIGAILSVGGSFFEDGFSSVTKQMITKFKRDIIKNVRLKTAGKIVRDLLFFDWANLASSGVGGVINRIKESGKDNLRQSPQDLVVQNLFDLFRFGPPDPFENARWTRYTPLGPPPGGSSVGGVMIDKAAELIGENLADIAGAVYDPVSRQVVFLGTDGQTASADIDMDYFHTAIKSVYGSAVPPFVTLDPPASVGMDWEDMGDNDDIFEDGESGGFLLHYHPIAKDPDDHMRIMFKMSWGETFDFVTGYVTATENPDSGLMQLSFDHWENLPDGVTLQRFEPFYEKQYPQGPQDSAYVVILRNESGNDYFVDPLWVVPDLQHRQFGGRVENTRLGWVMLEADRVMKCLGAGKDNLTGAVYDSETVPVPGFSNLLERNLSGMNRFWFVPDRMAIQRHADPETGRASMVFDQATVALLTDSMFYGAAADDSPACLFAEHFTQNYEAFAQMEWPVHDPSDPEGNTVIYAKIFQQLKEAMQAVALARFFHDNDIPLDSWWLSSWQPDPACTPETVPTVTNEKSENSVWIMLYGGVEINRPNEYGGSQDARETGDAALDQRPDDAGDLDAQTWSAETTARGDLVAAAASLDKRTQDGVERIAAVDILLESPGEADLTAARFYNGGFMGEAGFGPGWRPIRFALEFARPSWENNQYLSIASLGLDALVIEQAPDSYNPPQTLDTDDQWDTRLRSGEVRFVDYATGKVLDFESSLEISFDILTRSFAATGLDENGVPQFASKTREEGASLVQAADESKGYLLTFADGSKMNFDHQGRLTKQTDRHGRETTYGYAENGLIESIADSAGQQIVYFHDDNGRIVSASGPYAKEIDYEYDEKGRLASVADILADRQTAYQYNDDNQLVGSTGPDGISLIQSVVDIRGRAVRKTDNRGNTLEYSFEIDPETRYETTSVADLQAPEQAPWTRTFDDQGRIVSKTDPAGSRTEYEYDGQSMYVNRIAWPAQGRKPVEIHRNAAGLPVKIVDPENSGGQPVEISYNDANLPVEIIDPMGRATRFEYNEQYDLTALIRYLGGQPVVVSFGYENGRLVSVVDPMGRESTMEYDELGRAVSSTDASGISVGTTYDESGRPESIDDPRHGEPTVFAYDDLNRVTSISSAYGQIRFSYDSLVMRPSEIVAPDGNATRFDYDPATGDLLTATRVNPDGEDAVASFAYHRLGNLSALTSPEGDETFFEYDEMNRLVATYVRDRETPPAPPNLASDAAVNGQWTLETDHAFTWAAPQTDTGIAGYSFALNAEPDDDIDSSTPTASFENLAPGEYIFYVKAKSGSGLWGETAAFVLRITDGPMEVYARPENQCGVVPDCYEKIQDAIEAAGVGGVVRIQGGSYAENIVVDRHVTIEPGWKQDPSSPAEPVSLTGF